MATFTTHLLDSVHGTHAGGVAVTLARLRPDGGRETVLERVTDPGGRLVAEIDVPAGAAGVDYEIIIGAGAYFARLSPPREGLQIVKEIVIRFAMPDAGGRYHIPLIIAPNGYSAWWSS